MCQEWEEICNDDRNDQQRRTYRMTVEGGHLYRYDLDSPNSNESRAHCVAMVFVPAPPSQRSRGARVRVVRKGPRESA